jgi:two-component system phosphate regulon sensor histidine kinase PhoR
MVGRGTDGDLQPVDRARQPREVGPSAVRRHAPPALCDAPFVDPFLVASLVLLGLLVVVWIRATRRGRILERLSTSLGAPGGSPATLEARVMEAVDAAAAADRRRAADAAEVASLVAALPLGVLRVDDDLVVSAANPAAHEIADRPPGTMVGRSLIEAFVESRVEEVASIARAIGSGSGEVAIPGPSPHVLLVHARRVDGAIWVIVQDVSDLRRLERIRAEFVDNLSHELRTPLTNVSLLTESLVRQVESAGDGVDPKMRDRIERIEVETGHLVQMVNELLDLARIEAGSATTLVDDVDMAVVARASVARMRAFADQQRVRLEVDVPGEPPPIRGDEDRVGQVLVNLLHNAIKFSTAGGVVTVSVTSDGSEVTTSVEDRGIGIRRSDQARIFERFYKVDRARVRGGGTGLGLSIARHIVEAHGGRIGVRSREGAGSTFWFSLPVTRPESTPAGTILHPTQRASAS